MTAAGDDDDDDGDGGNRSSSFLHIDKQQPMLPIL
jgi:hypothetical protein